MGKESKDKIIECKECGENFVFPYQIQVKDLYQSITEEKAHEIFEKRNSLQEKIASLTEKGKLSEAKRLQEEFSKLEDMIIRLSNGNSQEAYNFRGFTNDPARCPKCRKKSKEEESKRTTRKTCARKR